MGQTAITSLGIAKIHPYGNPLRRRYGSTKSDHVGESFVSHEDRSNAGDGCHVSCK